jgi:hypothetical protein
MFVFISLICVLLNISLTPSHTHTLSLAEKVCHLFRETIAEATEGMLNDFAKEQRGLGEQRQQNFCERDQRANHW